MRNLVIAGLMAGLLGACSVGADGGQGPSAAAPAEGYTLEVIADDARQIYIVSHSDGRAVAARVEGGASALMDAGEAQAMAAQRFGVIGETEPPIALRFPGLQMSIAGKEDEAGERVRIAINAGGREVLVDAQDPAGGVDTAEQATVRIAGADENDAREFIREAEDLSDATRDEMRAALGFSAQ